MKNDPCRVSAEYTHMRISCICVSTSHYIYLADVFYPTQRTESADRGEVG
uniref:Uncharacterized protein n=1 Tax=Anguilla anguilla TaxID=7936 RepID=A0A0E9S4F3_ANGAN